MENWGPGPGLFDEIGIAFRKSGMRSSVASAIWKLKFMIQENNQGELEKLVSEKGWPKISDVGQPAVMADYLARFNIKYQPQNN